MLNASNVAKLFREMPEFKKATSTFNEKKYKVYPPNPWMTLNGFDGDSPLTEKNIGRRKLKGYGSKLFSLGGSAGAHFGTVVNTASIAKHAVAEGSTLAHTARLVSMASKVKDGGSLRAMLDDIIAIKGLKASMRAVSLGLAAIPDIGMAGTAAGLAVTIAQKLGFKATEVMDLQLAIKLHWQAYRELKLLGGRAGTGPALSIVHELTTKGLKGKIDFGDLHSVSSNNKIMLEPAGYAVILFKLQQD